MKKIITVLVLVLTVGVYSEDEKQKEVIITEPTLEFMKPELTIEPKIEPKTESIPETKNTENIFSEEDIEALKIRDLTIPQIDRKISELETKSFFDGERIVKLEKILQEKEQQISELENKVEGLATRTKVLEEKNESLNKNPLENITDEMYKIGLLIAAVLLGITIILIGAAMFQSSKNKKMIEEWKEFFEMNVDRLNREAKENRENID